MPVTSRCSHCAGHASHYPSADLLTCKQLLPSFHCTKELVPRVQFCSLTDMHAGHYPCLPHGPSARIHILPAARRSGPSAHTHIQLTAHTGQAPIYIYSLQPTRAKSSHTFNACSRSCSCSFLYLSVSISINQSVSINQSIITTNQQPTSINYK